ncbi:MAG: DUF1961 family protein [Candidatus Aminicenantes bacterium]|nr:MAG: DUF1961 family protein [Candidatus Aminicenantes bacterium]
MKTRLFLINALMLYFVFFSPLFFAGDNPVSREGTVSFILHTDKTYSNGKWEHVFTQPLVELPGLAKCILERSYANVSITFQWEKDEIHRGFYLVFKELPGPGKYFIQFTWDAGKGLADMYMNGISARKENSRYYTPWEVKGAAVSTRIPPGANRVTEVNVLSEYLPEEEALKQVPKELSGKMAHLLITKNLPSPLDMKKRKGKLLYASKMNNKASMMDWVLEGPAEIRFQDNMMIMRSQIPNPPDDSTGHFNYWCPVDFPGDFIAEWEFKPLKEPGLTHIFFAAKGVKGEDIFDPALPERDGHYSQYHSGAINNYYIIYYSNRRVLRTTNIATIYLTKSPNPSTLALGQIGITPGVMEFHRLRLIKDGGHIQLLVNGKVYLDCTDPGSDRWGPVLGGGKIGFRQMAETEAAYRNFNVWELCGR